MIPSIRAITDSSAQQAVEEARGVEARVEPLASLNPAVVKTQRRPARRANFVEHSFLYHQSDCIICLLHFDPNPSMPFERSGRDLQQQR